ncbi:unnamed protein product [Rotaria socialis]|uniref:DNA-directed primase/polymerase protein n=2 Tax=Rotaria socialis TaxID=392032 RepID=A0A820XMB8_9BILA|nr:unnamed protein product [Rotaria socialis]CAF4534702.1 unnamed protein product [Rotaria socialis]
MSFVHNLIKRLFPYRIISHHISDLDIQSLQLNTDKNDIVISIEKENTSRHFCCLTIEELTTLFEYCPIIHRTLYESISLDKPIKTYIDFEYFIDKNLYIEDHYKGPMSCLKILYYFLNVPNDTINTSESYTKNILKQFLVLEASTSEKISYHLIHANPSALFQNTTTLRIFMKTIIHFLLLSIIQHKCTTFNINLTVQECATTSNLINQLVPFVNTLRKHCNRCNTSIPFLSIADIAYLLVQNKTNQWTLAIDTNVYSKNQQLRLFESFKYGKNNPLVLSTKFPFHSEIQYSYPNLLKKSLITFMEHDIKPKIYLKDKNFVVDLSSISNPINTLSYNFIHVNLLNQYIDPSIFYNPPTNINIDRNLPKSKHFNTIENLSLSIPDMQMFLNFVENIITSESTHQGYVHSCIRGTYNKNLLFFNIAGNYRFCPKKNDHHKRNTVAIMVDTKNYIYCTRCKDIECNNTILSWKKIK